MNKRTKLRRLPFISAALPVIAAISTLCAGCVSAHYKYNREANGLHYSTRTMVEPRPNRVHILKVDLSNSRIEPAIALAPDPDGDGPAETKLTDPRTLANDPDVLAFINANPWDAIPDKNGKRNRHWYDGQPVDIYGLAVSRSKTRSPARPRGVGVRIDNAGRAHVGYAEQAVSVREGVAGFRLIMKEGKIIAKPSAQRHPRTAVGVDKSGMTLWMVVVDGRQKGYSDGMTTHELAGLMKDLGCWDAANMDGGGSSIMGLTGPNGAMRVMNRPSGRKFGISFIRPLPTVLTIRRR